MKQCSLLSNDLVISKYPTKDKEESYNEADYSSDSEYEDDDDE